MVERQPGRPDENLFIGAALRFLKGECTGEPVHMTTGMFANVYTIYPGKNLDEYLIRQEWEADGLKGEPETMADFALRQIAAYQKQKRH